MQVSFFFFFGHTPHQFSKPSILNTCLSLVESKGWGAWPGVQISCSSGKHPFCNFVTPSSSGLLPLKLLVAQSCPTLCHPKDCSPTGSSVHGILQARKLEWVAIPFSRGSSRECFIIFLKRLCLCLSTHPDAAFLNFAVEVLFIQFSEPFPRDLFHKCL